MALTDAERAVVAKVWHGRATGERGTAETFRVVADGLAALDAEPELVALARRAVADELRHAERCWQLACDYAGRELARPRVLPLELPTYDGAGDELRHTLHVAGQCCLNETTASAFLERCYQDATEAPVRAVPSWATIDEVVATAFDELIVPGFAHVGIAITR